MWTVFVQVIAKTRAVGAVGEALIVFLFGYGKVKVVLLVDWPSEDCNCILSWLVR